MAIALSSSVSLARFVAPIVSFLLPLVWAFRLPMISSRASRVNFVEGLISRFAFMLIMWISSREEQPENILAIFVTFDVSNCGTVVRLVQ